MNTAVQKAANVIYERARTRSAQIVGEEKRQFGQTLALRRSRSHLPLSGPEFQAVTKISGQHVERCIRARFDSYRQAFTGAEMRPTDQDFREILNSVNAACDQEVRHAASALQQYAHANGFHVGTGTGIDPAAMLMAQSAWTHEGVVDDWKVWRAEIDLQAEAAKKQQTAPVVPKMSWATVRRQIWSWPVVTPISLLLLGFLGNPMYAGDLVVTSVSCFVGLALLTAKFITWDQTKNLSNRRTANAAVTVGAAIVLVGVIVLAKKRVSPPPALPLITMQISPTSLPVSIPAHTVASILQMHPWIGMPGNSDGLLKVANDTGKEGCWPKRTELASIEPNGHEGVYHVEITNHSDRMVESGKAKFGIKYNAGMKRGGCMAPTDHRPDQFDVVLIPPLDPGKTFEFYVTNPSNLCAWLLPPATAVMKISGQEKEVDVPLTLDKNPLYAVGAPSFSPTAIKWEGVPTHPNGYGVIRRGSESCENPTVSGLPPSSRSTIDDSPHRVDAVLQAKPTSMPTPTATPIVTPTPVPSSTPNASQRPIKIFLQRRFTQRQQEDIRFSVASPDGNNPQEDVSVLYYAGTNDKEVELFARQIAAIFERDQYHVNWGVAEGNVPSGISIYWGRDESLAERIKRAFFYAGVSGPINVSKGSDEGITIVVGPRP